MPAELGPVRVRRVPGLRAAELAAAWDRLAAEALEENPFFTAAYMLAGLRHLNERSVPDLLCVERAPIDGGAALLIGVLPLEMARFRYGVPLPLGVAASHVFQTSGTPLLHRDHAADAADALLGALCRDPAVRGRALLPHLRLAGATARLLGERAGPAGLRSATLCDLRR
ncbi:MAG: hypothetical protein JWR86_3521, partial [Enterovirga sp.]|nr:hypothetical protein [Enterovirga sp.]